LTKDAKNLHWKKDSPFNKYWENWISTCKRLKLDPYFSPCTKINSKWIKDSNRRQETLKLLEENIGIVLEDIGLGNTFLNRTPIVQKIRITIEKWEFHQIKNFIHSKGNNY
jgi:hypothetical protein